MCRDALRMSKSSMITLLSPLAKTSANAAVIVVFPSPDTEEVIDITLLFSFPGRNCKLVRMFLNASV